MSSPPPGLRLEEESSLVACALETMREGIAVFRAKSRTLIYASAALERLFAFETGDLLALPLTQLLVEPRPRWTDALAGKLDERGEAVTEAIGRRKDGSRFRCRTRWRKSAHATHGELWVGAFEEQLERRADEPLPGTAPTPSAVAEGATDGVVIGVAHDITDRKAIEEALRKSEERFRLVAQATNDVLWDWDIPARTIWFSQALAAAYGHAETEVSVDWRFEQMHPQDAGRVGTGIRNTIELGEDLWSDEYRFRRGDGSWVDVLDRAFVLRDELGRPQRMLGSMLDITARKRSEEQRAELVRELAGVNRELNDFAYVVSHDLKAPLRGIGSLATWINSDYADRLDDEGRENIRLMLRRVTRMSDLIDGILRYSRVGRVREEVALIDVQAFLPEVVDLLGLAPEVIVRIDGALPEVPYGRTSLQQVFQNLLSNAVKFGDKAPCEVVIRAEDDGRFSRFSVKDNGPGIDRRYHDRIFQIFQTLAPRDRAENTGVGLAIVKKIVEIHGGRVWVESELGAGSTFYFTVRKAGR